MKGLGGQLVWLICKQNVTVSQSSGFSCSAAPLQDQLMPRHHRPDRQAKQKWEPHQPRNCSRLGSGRRQNLLLRLPRTKTTLPSLPFPLLFSLPSSSSLLASASLDGEILYVLPRSLPNVNSLLLRLHRECPKKRQSHRRCLVGQRVTGANQSTPRAVFSPLSSSRSALVESESVRRATPTSLPSFCCRSRGISRHSRNRFSIFFKF